MKLKCRPKDFQVREITNRQPTEGQFAFYRLRKRSIGTLEAATKIAKHWSIPVEKISVGGLKDRHALTEQYLTIEGGPAESLHLSQLELEYLGQTDRPYSSEDIVANRFWIVVRSLTRRRAERAKEELHVVAEHGLPNYFDKQRFGSLGRSRQFVAEAWCKGDYQRALWLAVADLGFHDRPRQRAEKLYLQQHWGNWEACLNYVHSKNARRALRHLVRRPNDFRRAFARIDVRLRRLFLAAYQSFLWNEVLAELLRTTLPADQLEEVSLAVQKVPFYRQLPEQIRDQLSRLQIPLPSARSRYEDPQVAELVNRVLERMGLQLRQLRVRYPRDSFFSNSPRSVLFFPRNVSAAVHKDELYEGRRKVILQFELPRGSYATLVVKRLFKVAS